MGTVIHSGKLRYDLSDISISKYLCRSLRLPHFGCSGFSNRAYFRDIPSEANLVESRCNMRYNSSNYYDAVATSR